MVRIVVALFVLLISSAGASAQNTYRTFQGTAFVTAVTSQCADKFVVGSFFTHVYRQKMAAADPADAMSFVTDRSAFRVLSTDASGGLQGAVPTNNAYISHQSNFAAGLVSATSLTISSSGGAALTVANSLKYVGTVNDFFGIAGCVVTIRAVGVLRPDL